MASRRQRPTRHSDQRRATNAADPGRPADQCFVAYPNIRDPELFEAIIQKTIEEAQTSIAKTKQRGRKIKPGRNGAYNRAWAYTQGRQLLPRTVHIDRGSAEMSYIRVYEIDGTTFEWTKDKPIPVPGR